MASRSIEQGSGCRVVGRAVGAVSTEVFGCLSRGVGAQRPWGSTMPGELEEQ